MDVVNRDRRWTLAALHVPLMAATVLGIATWVNRLLGHSNLGAGAITLTVVGAVLLHQATAGRESPGFAAVAAGCALALAGMQVGLSCNPRLALVPTFVVFAAAARGAGRAQDARTLQRTERLGRAAFGVAVLAGVICLGVLVRALRVRAAGASWG